MHVTQLPYVTLDLSAGGMARIQLALELGPLEERVREILKQFPVSTSPAAYSSPT